MECIKHHQLLAGLYQIGNNISTNITHSIVWLEKAAKGWNDMASYNFYGTDYVMADPFKEYVDVISELGILLCMNKSYTKGLLVLNETVLKQKQTINGYNNIRIATNDIIRDGQSKLIDILINAGKCFSELVISSSDYKEYNILDYQYYRNILKESLNLLYLFFNGKQDSRYENVMRLITTLDNIMMSVNNSTVEENNDSSCILSDHKIEKKKVMKLIRRKKRH